MPRVRIHLHDIDDIEELEEQEDWEEQIGLRGLDQRAMAREGAETRGRNTEARERKRAERRKDMVRSGRRFSQQRV